MNLAKNKDKIIKEILFAIWAKYETAKFEYECLVEAGETGEDAAFIEEYRHRFEMIEEFVDELNQFDLPKHLQIPKNEFSFRTGFPSKPTRLKFTRLKFTRVKL